jgi:hypothetical protein
MWYALRNVLRLFCQIRIVPILNNIVPDRNDVLFHMTYKFITRIRRLSGQSSRLSTCPLLKKLLPLKNVKPQRGPSHVWFFFMVLFIFILAHLGRQRKVRRLMW